MVAVSVEFGREMTARPDMKITHLTHSGKTEISFWFRWIVDSG